MELHLSNRKYKKYFLHYLQDNFLFTRTPQYLNVNVDHDVGAFIELYLPSDEATSDSKEFTFKSSEIQGMQLFPVHYKFQPNFHLHDSEYL